MRRLSRSLVIGAGIGGIVLFALPVLAAPSSSETGALSGVVTDKGSKGRVSNALVMVQCTCLPEPRETQTNDQGLFRVGDLPPGVYTIQVLAGNTEASRSVTLLRGARLRADVVLDVPVDVRDVVVRTPVRRNSAGGGTYKMDEVGRVPLGSDTGRDATAVVDMVSSAARDKGGITLGGLGSAEQEYTLEGQNISNPISNTLTSSLVQEFVESVDVQESGYDAEFGGVSGGVVAFRRISGTNKVRGQARITYTPRLARPRYVLATDNAIRAIEVPDYLLQGVVRATGPVIKDRLWWAFGAVATGGQASLVQSFHKRIDKDGSGGFEPCPYENGDFDCAEGSDYIATEKFAEQRFKTGGVEIGLLAGLDWQINRNHRIQVTARTDPDFQRRAFRRPIGFDLTGAAFGINPNADPVGGGLRTANGIVNDHFGWDRSNSTNVSLGYLGRVASDKLEIDANVGYGQWADIEAWRLDNPEHRRRPATQISDTQGANLFRLLDDENSIESVPGVERACNTREIPGLVCPVRQWVSGGLGDYGEDYARRVEGSLKLTHFFNAAGAHQLKYGTSIEHLERRTRRRYSGENADDFYDNCGDREGGGEWCFGPEGYSFDSPNRVNNHRYIVANADNPDNRVSYGFGRVRVEQGELRAIATPLGAGARVDEYDAKLSTQDYAVFLQDKWNILSNLNIGMGVRWEVQDMRNILGERAVFVWDNVAPRFNIVYDWTDEGKSRLYASYGWFFQRMPLELNSRVFGGLVNVQRTFRNSDCVGRSVQVDNMSYFKYDDGQPTEWCTDFNASTTQLTEGAVVPNLKGQYIQQLQIGYEQEVIEDLILGVRWLHNDQRRTVEDISTDGGLNYIIANPGVSVPESAIEAQEQECASLQSSLDSMSMDDPIRTAIARDLQRCEFLVDAYGKVGSLFDRPRRTYDAFTFEVKKRLAKNWLIYASYTYSRLRGNYEGFVDPNTGAINLGASTQYDTPELVRNSFGPLPFDTPHQLKVDGSYTFSFDSAGALTVGTSFRLRSGYPISVRAGNNRFDGLYPTYVVPRGAGGRVEPTYTWNLSIGYAYPLPQQLELEIAARLINVTNAKAVVRVDEVYSFQNTRPVAGGNLEDLKHAKVQSDNNPTDFFQRNIMARSGNYGVEASFQTPIAAQFDVVLRF